MTTWTCAVCGTKDRNKQALMHPTHCVACIGQLPPQQLDRIISAIFNHRVRTRHAPSRPVLQTVAGEIG